MAQQTFLINNHTDSNPDNWTLLATLLSDGSVRYPQWSYQPYSVYVTTGGGTRKGLGYPIVKWTFAGLNLKQRESLRGFCTDVSEPVYIRTPINETTSGARQYKDYDCLMNWTERSELANDGIEVVEMVEITFTHCVVVV